MPFYKFALLLKMGLLCKDIILFDKNQFKRNIFSYNDGDVIRVMSHARRNTNFGVYSENNLRNIRPHLRHQNVYIGSMSRLILTDLYA